MRLKRYYSALSRYHKSNGYGIHSPFAFKFVLNVLRERLPYYSYEPIEELRHKAVQRTRHHGRHPRIISLKNAKILFRLVNYFNPPIILQVGTSYGISSACMLMVSSKTHLFLCEPNLSQYPVVNDILSPYSKQIATHRRLSDGLQAYTEASKGTPHQPFVLVNDVSPESYDELMEFLLPICRSQGVIVIRNISRNPLMKDVWTACKDYSTTGMTFTNEKMAIIIASTKLPQQDFFLWF